MEKNKIYSNSIYFFIFAHPDDEVYSCILMRRLIKIGKEVHAIYATSGDKNNLGKIRENEVLKSLQIIGIKKSFIHFLKVEESDFLNKLNDIVNLIIKLAENSKPDCVVGQDYEGGHEGHDAINFCASEIARLLKIKDYYVFPIYHGKPKERKGARFKPSRKNIITLPLSKKESELKIAALNSHKSQKNHFKGLIESTNDYLKLLTNREVYCKILRPINYEKKPTAEIGYEYHRNNFKFSDFIKALKKYKSVGF